MDKQVSNGKLVIKNTLFLYIRMIILMCISIYTSRVVLEALGVTNFGIYNVVGGIVTLIGFLNNSMANAVQRFLSYEMGKGTQESVNNIFNISLLGHIVIIFIVFILAEAIGIWLVNFELDIPTDRHVAANWVLQTSIIITLISFIQVPYNAIIISKERMAIYAYISLIEGLLRLFIAFAVLHMFVDKLIIYSILQLFVSIVITFLYYIYCHRKIPESRFHIVKDLGKFKVIFSFVSYNLIGEISQVCIGQGLSIILNIFCGPVVNAARGLADQVNGNVSKFVNNIQQALNPQIVKTYAKGDINSTFNLLYRGVKFSYYMLFIITLPLILEMNLILKLWLKTVPEYTAIFCKIILIASLIGCCSGLLSQAVRANGKIKNYQIICSLGGILCLPAAYFILKFTSNPIIAMAMLILVQIILYFTRLIMTSKIIGLSIRIYLIKTLVPIFIVTILSSLITIITYNVLPDSLLRLFIIIFISIVSIGISSYFLGMTKSERIFINNIFISLKSKLI